MAAAAATVAAQQEEGKDPKKKKKLWVRPWLKEKGHYNQLLPDILDCEDHESYMNFHRMDADVFQEILERITPRIQKQDTNMRTTITPGERLSLTLKYLTTGGTYRNQEYQFRVAANTISLIVPETCRAIIDEW